MCPVGSVCRISDLLLCLVVSADFYFYISIMQNEAGENVDLYVPRKCSWTNRLVKAKEHSSVQINVANVDPVTGVSTGDSTPYCIGGYIRFKSEGDMALTSLVQKKDIAVLAGPAAE
jgi:small subunit ribosomal protein S21e